MGGKLLGTIYHKCKARSCRGGVALRSSELQLRSGFEGVRELRLVEKGLVCVCNRCVDEKVSLDSCYSIILRCVAWGVMRQREDLIGPHCVTTEERNECDLPVVTTE
eukprot:scaffold2246_cov215-Pinguiococcus_pyrenoidosus.AAC.3